MEKLIGSPILHRVLQVRTTTPQEAALAARMKNYKGRTCGKIATYNAGCRCVDCKETSRQIGQRRRRQNGVESRYE